MAFPTATTLASARTTNGTSLVINYPSTAAAGDLVLVFAGADSGASAFTWPGGWASLGTANFTGFIAEVVYAVQSGGETSVTVTHTSERSNAIAVLIPAASWHGTSAPEMATPVTGSSTTPNPPSLTPSWGADDTLWIAGLFADDSNAPLPVTSWPTNYADNQTQQYSNTSACDQALATRGLNAASEDPGTFTMTKTETWSAVTVAVRPAASGNTVNISAALTGSASASGTPSMERGVSAAFSATASASATASVARYVDASLSGAASLTATLSTGSQVAIASSLSASAAITATLARTMLANASLSAGASLAATASALRLVSAGLTAGATFTAAPSMTVGLAAPLSATATLSGSPSMTVGQSASFTAGSSLYAVLTSSGDTNTGPPPLGSMLTLKVGR
jgi:hypothetical protein